MKTKKDIRSLMAQDIFTRRPLDDKTIQYCANDVAHLPALQNVYSKRLSGEWQIKVMDESARRVTEACRISYDPHSELKKLGPWCSQSDRNVLTMEEAIDRWELEKMDTIQQDLFGYDDCYESDPFDEPVNSKDAAWDDTFDSCWDTVNPHPCDHYGVEMNDGIGLPFRRIGSNLE
jgi:exonuclease 3'-5' domain-containing protein 1